MNTVECLNKNTEEYHWWGKGAKLPTKSVSRRDGEICDKGIEKPNQHKIGNNSRNADEQGVDANKKKEISNIKPLYE